MPGSLSFRMKRGSMEGTRNTCGTFPFEAIEKKQQLYSDHVYKLYLLLGHSNFIVL